METDDVLLSDLRSMFSARDWFYDVGYDQYKRPVLYIKFECHETIWDIPSTIYGKQLLVHYAVSIKATKEQFFVKPEPPALVTFKPFVQAVQEAQTKGIDLGNDQLDPVEEAVGTGEEEKSLRHLTNELDRLEKQCGSYTLQDIFYEIHDGPNAVTNMSARYPDVQKGLCKLYQQYGFNVIYEELDG